MKSPVTFAAVNDAARTLRLLAATYAAPDEPDPTILRAAAAIAEARVTQLHDNG